MIRNILSSRKICIVKYALIIVLALALPFVFGINPFQDYVAGILYVGGICMFLLSNFLIYRGKMKK